MISHQLVSFQGSFEDPVFWYVSLQVFLFGVAHFLALLLIARRLSPSFQNGFIAFGVALGASTRLAWLVFGVASHDSEAHSLVFGILLLLLSLLSVPSYHQRAMPAHGRMDWAAASVWMLIVSLAFTHLSATSNLSVSPDLIYAITAASIGYLLAIGFSWLLFVNARKIRGLILATSWIVGVCGLRLLIEGLDGDGRWDFSSPKSLGTILFWLAFLSGVIAAVFVKRARKQCLPEHHLGRASFLLRR